MTLKLLATDKNCEKQQFLSSLGPLPQRVDYFTQFEVFSHVGGSRRSHINLNSEIVNLKWVNPKYKTDCFIWTECKLHWCHFAFKIQCSVVSWGYLLRNSLGSFIQRYASGTSSDNEWINLHRFWIHLLLMFALTSGVMRNDLFVFKIIIPAQDRWQKKNFNQNDHSLSFAVTRYLLLSFIVTLCSTRCH